MKINSNRKPQYVNGAIASVLLAVSMTASLPAMAEDSTGSGSISRERLLHKFDVDGDGTLSQREKYHARKAYTRMHQNANNRPANRETPRRMQRPVNNR